MQYYIPRENQIKGEQWLYERKAAGLWFDMGLGKTAIVLAAFKRLRDEGKVDCMVVCGPLKVVQTVWPGELRKWIDFHELTYELLQGPGRQEALLRHADIYLVNYENVKWLLEQPAWVAGDKKKVLVFDELSKMKSWDSQRTKAFRLKGDKGFSFLLMFEYRWGLTGTPASNGYEDLFAQTYMLDMGDRLGEHRTKFLARYFQPSQHSRRLEPIYGAREELGDLVADLYLRMDADDWLKLPEELDNYIELELPELLQKQYQVLEDEFILNLSEEVCLTATSSSALSMKLRQFLSGRMYDDLRVVHKVHDIKYDALDEFIEAMNGEPLLLAYVFDHEKQEILRRHKHAVLLDSSVSAAKSNKIVADFNAGRIPLLLGHPASIGHGLNLQEGCNNVGFFSQDFNLDNYLQFKKRVARSGQRKKSVVCHYWMFKGTIETAIVKALQAKNADQQWLLDYSKQYSVAD